MESKRVLRGSSGLILWKRYGLPETKSEQKTLKNSGLNGEDLVCFWVKRPIFRGFCS